jgi:RNA polymerase sigma factor (sigma-70 family)
MLRQLQFAVAAWREDDRSDTELLRLFVDHRDERAFSTLVGRYGGLVWGVCRRGLGNTTDAEDAFQAAFLKLARDAHRILNRHTLAAWLYRVARCSAIDLRRKRDRHHQRHEPLAADVIDAHDAQHKDALLLDDELANLPDRDRAVLVLCLVEGRSYQKAATELGCSTAAVHRRLEKAKLKLRDRLLEHAPALGVTAALAALGGRLTAVPPGVLAGTTDAGLATTPVVPLPFESLAAILMARPLVWLGGAGVALVLALSTVAVEPTPEPSPAAAPPAVAHVKTTPLIGTVRDADGDPVPGATVTALARDPYEPGGRGLRDTPVAAATTDPHGRFRLNVPEFPSWFAERAVTVHATAPGRAPATTTARVKPGAALDVRMGESLPLRARLLDADGNPAAGVTARVVRIGDAANEPSLGANEPPLPGWPGLVTAGPDGAIVLPGLGAATVGVRVEDPRFAVETVRLDADRDEVRLKAAVPFVVTVRAADTGRSLPHARVTVVTSRPRTHAHFCDTEQGLAAVRRNRGGEFDAVADADGTLRLPLARGEAAELLVHPPDASAPFVGVRETVLPCDPTGESLGVKLPRGAWVVGTVRDEAGPVAGAIVHWGRVRSDRPEWKDDLLAGRDALVRTAADGSFRLPVPAEPCTVRVYGPSQDFAPVPLDLPATDRTLYAHAVVPVDAARPVPPLDVRLEKVNAVVGAVCGNRPGTVVLAAGRVSPVRGYSCLPLPVAGDRYALPGVATGSAARAYFLNPVAKLGAVADITGAAGPTVHLKPCGTAVLEVTDAAGKPLAEHTVSAALLVRRDAKKSFHDRGGPGTAGVPPAHLQGIGDLSAAAGSEAGGTPAVPGIEATSRMGTPAVEEPQPLDWFDAVNHAARPVTDAAGRAELAALIPDAEYAVTVSGPRGTATARFRATSGEPTKFVLTVRPAEGSR